MTKFKIIFLKLFVPWLALEEFGDDSWVWIFWFGIKLVYEDWMPEYLLLLNIVALLDVLPICPVEFTGDCIRLLVDIVWLFDLLWFWFGAATTVRILAVEDEESEFDTCWFSVKLYSI